MSRQRPALALVCLAALGAALVLAREVAYGVMLTWDSVDYVGVARNLLAGEGFTLFLGGYYKGFPPLYPALLAGASLGVFDPLAVAGPVNAVLFGLTVFVAGWWLWRRLESRLLALWGCAAVAVAWPLTWMASWAMSETAFILLALLALIQTEKFLEGGKRSALVAAAALAALACLTRYLGVSVVLAVALLLVFQRGATSAEKARSLTVYATVSLLPLCLWMLRTFLLTGTLAGKRGRVFHQLPEILDDVFHELTRWAAHGLPLTLAVVSLLAAGLAATWGFVQARPGLASRDWRSFSVFGGFALVYVALLVLAIMLGGVWSGFEARYLAPIYIPLLLVAALALERSFRGLRADRLPDAKPLAKGGAALLSPLALATLMAMLPLWLVYQGALNAHAIHRANQGVSLGYASARWAHSESLEYVRAATLGGALFSNYPAAAYIHTDTLAKHRYIPCDESKLRPRLTAAGADGPVHVLWFHTSGNEGCSPDVDKRVKRFVAWGWRPCAGNEGCAPGVSKVPLFKTRQDRALGLPWLTPVVELADGALFEFSVENAPEKSPADLEPGPP